MQTQGVNQCTDVRGGDDAGWSMVAVRLFRLGRTGLSDGLTWMLVKAEDGGDFSDDDIGADADGGQLLGRGNTWCRLEGLCGGFDRLLRRVDSRRCT